jgi:hypothetical protein
MCGSVGGPAMCVKEVHRLGYQRQRSFDRLTIMAIIIFMAHTPPPVRTTVS